MPSLTDNELRAIAYYAIGVSTEGSDSAYKLTFCGYESHGPDGSALLEPIGNSGYTIGEMQTDFGAQPKEAQALVNSFQTWAKANHPDWVLNEQQASKLASDLGRDGNHIRDPNYSADIKKYGDQKHIPTDLFPKAGSDIDPTFKSHLDAYLASDAGKTFTHNEDIAQVNNLMTNVASNLKQSYFYNNATPEDQAKIFAVVAKSYNQGPAWANQILQGIDDGKINSLDDISKKIDTFHDGPQHYMRTGRDAALSGAETFNALRNASERNAMHEPWQAVAANPLINPTQVGTDPKQPNLADQYATVKGTFVQPAQGSAFINALEKGGSYNYGDPSKSNSRGFYVEGNDFVQWDKNGQGRAFVGGQWSEFSRNEISLSPNKDHTLDIDITRNGETHSLLHVTHPSGHIHNQPAAHPDHAAGTLHQGMHNDQVKNLQTQLGELGYLDNTGTPDGKFGPATAKAVESFQHDHHLSEDGRAGPATQQAIQAELAPFKQQSPGLLPATAAGAPGLDDPRNALNPDHALYNELKTRIPDASENRLLQFTAACHTNKITADNLSSVRLDEANMTLSFSGSSPLSTPANVDLKTPPPQPQQAIQQIQQHDQQQAQMMNQTQAQNAQVNQQGQTR